jgi:hypothetical protein
MSCNCIKTIETQLQERTGDPELRINTGILFDVEAPSLAVRPSGLSCTYREKKSDGTFKVKAREQSIIPLYCPWCGTRYEKPAQSGVTLIQQERQRQIEVKGYDAARDDKYMGQELALAAAAFALPKDAAGQCIIGPEGWEPLDAVEYIWPSDWDWVHFNTRGARITELAKAGALIAAEIDRRLRAEAADASQS